jgi:hypothetical protein
MILAETKESGDMEENEQAGERRLEGKRRE